MIDQTTLKNVMFAAIDEALSNVHTCTIAKVVSVNTSTLDVKPVFNRVFEEQSIELPVFLDVPLFTLHGGSSYIHMPIAVGDYCLLIFTERCSDSWLAGTDNVTPLEYRMHDYSDGFAIVGVHNSGQALTIPTVIQVTGDSNHDGNAVHTGDRTQTGDITQTGDKTQTGDLGITGNLTITGGNITITGGDITVDGLSFENHVHGGVETGAGVTGVPQ